MTVVIPSEEVMAAASEALQAELRDEADELKNIFDGVSPESEAIQKLNNPHFLTNYISPDGQDDDDDFRPY